MTAFVLDPEHVQASEDGMTIAGVPGLWTNDRPMLPAALGLTLAAMREMVADLGLPLVEVKVAESKAHDAFPANAALLPSESMVDTMRHFREGDVVEAEAATGEADVGGATAPIEAQVEEPPNEETTA